MSYGQFWMRSCRLAERNGKTPSGTYFPISKSKDIFLDDGYYKMRKLSDDDKATVADIEPYRGGHPLLFLLHEADRVRKHQNLLACSGRGSMTATGSGHVGMMMASNEEGMLKRLGETITIGIFYDFELDVNSVYHVVYSEPEDLSGRSVIGLLAEFCPCVWGILARFD